MIILSFDDCHIEGWAGMVMGGKSPKAMTFYVSDLAGVSPARWQMLRDIEAAGHEIGFHGMRHLRADRPLDWDAFMRDEIDEGLKIMESEGFIPAHYSYPYGAYSQESNRRLLERFKTLRAVNAGGLYRVGEMPSVWAAIEFDFDRKDRAVLCPREPGDVACVFMHLPNPARLALLMEMAAGNGEEFVTVSDAFSRISMPSKAST